MSEPSESHEPEDTETDNAETDNTAEAESSEQTVSSQTSVDELLGYIDQAEVLRSKARSDIKALSDIEDFAERCEKSLEIEERILPELSELKEKAKAVSGIASSPKTAGREYFNMACDVEKSYSEVLAFYVDYYQFRDSVRARPEVENYVSTGEYAAALNEWYESVKEAYTAFGSCPSCLKENWKQYGEILDLNASICQKMNLAAKYEDPLRYQSALNMSDRYAEAENLKDAGIKGCLAGQTDHYRRQWEASSGLAEEIYAYAELDEAEQSEYEFENVLVGELSVNYDAIDTIYPSLYNSYDAFLVIKTGCISGTRNILVEAEIPGFTQKYKESFTLDSSYKVIDIKPPALTGDINLSVAKAAQLTVEITDQDGTWIDTKSFPVTIKSKYDFDWISDEYGFATRDNILCFLTPESSSITELKRKAIDEISGMSNSQMESFVGYQNTKWGNHYVGTYLQSAGIMRALYESGVRYNMDTFSLSGSNQHILLPEDVVNQKSGLCIETSLVVASALQSAGMHAFLVLPTGHAQVAVEAWNGKGNDTHGTGEYFLIETTALSDASNSRQIFVEGTNSLLKGYIPEGSISFYNHDEWKEYLAEKGTYLIDCDDSRVFGLTQFAN